MTLSDRSYELPNNVVRNSKNPMVSVKTLAYNHQPFIRQCMESVLSQQTEFPIEYVIGEDYSTDGTREIVFDYARRHPDVIRVITSDCNVGMKANSDRSNEVCRGKYLAFCEGDDYWIDPRKLQKQVKLLEANPEQSMSFHLTEVRDEISGKRRIRGPGWLRNKPVIDSSYLIQRNGGFICTCSMMIRAECVRGLPQWISAAQLAIGQ